MTCGLRKEVIMRKQTRHRFVATNYNRDERHLPFLLYNFYFMRFAQRRKGKLAKTKIFLSLTSGVCFFLHSFSKTTIQYPWHKMRYTSCKCCSRCGYIYTKLTLKQREWDCPSCGTHHERDVNAAINICRMGLVQMGYPA